MPGRRQVPFFLQIINLCIQTKQRYFTRPSAANLHGGAAAGDGDRAPAGRQATSSRRRRHPPRHHRQRAGRAPVQQSPGFVTGVTSALVSSFRTPVIAHTRHQPTIIASPSGVSFPRDSADTAAAGGGERRTTPRPRPESRTRWVRRPAVPRHSSLHRALSSTATLDDDGIRPALPYCRAGRSSLRRRHQDWRRSRRRRVCPASVRVRRRCTDRGTPPPPTAARRRRLAGRQVLGRRQVLGWRRVPGRRGVQSRRRVSGPSLKQCSTDVIVKHTDSGKDALKVKHRAAKPMTMCLTQFFITLLPYLRKFTTNLLPVMLSIFAVFFQCHHRQWKLARQSQFLEM